MLVANINDTARIKRVNVSCDPKDDSITSSTQTKLKRNNITVTNKPKPPLMLSKFTK